MLHAFFNYNNPFLEKNRLVGHVNRLYGSLQCLIFFVIIIDFICYFV